MPSPVTLPNAWEVERFDGPRRVVEFRRYGDMMPNIGRDLSESVRKLYERRLLARALPSAMSRHFVLYDPEVSEVFSAAGEAASEVLEKGLSEVEEQ